MKAVHRGLKIKLFFHDDNNPDDNVMESLVIFGSCSRTSSHQSADYEANNVCVELILDLFTVSE